MSKTATPMTKEEKVATIARVCHDANKAWCDAHGDDTQLPWDEAAEWQRLSAIAGVQVALDGATPEQQHDAWCADKEQAGWVYGAVKDACNLTHPCLVPYSDLPEMQKSKDALFGAIVRSLAPTLGLA